MHVYGGISLKGITEIFVLRDYIDSNLLVEIIDEILLPDSKELIKEKKWYLA